MTLSDPARYPRQEVDSWWSRLCAAGCGAGSRAVPLPAQPATHLLAAQMTDVPCPTHPSTPHPPLPAAGEAAVLLDNAQSLGQLIGLPLSTVVEAEAHLAAALGGDTGAVSALRVLQLYLERLGCTLLVSGYAGRGWLAGWLEQRSIVYLLPRLAACVLLLTLA